MGTCCRKYAHKRAVGVGGWGNGCIKRKRKMAERGPGVEGPQQKDLEANGEALASPRGTFFLQGLGGEAEIQV